MIKKFTVTGSSVILLLTLSGCARYKARPLGHLSGTISLEKQGVSFASKTFDTQDCKEYLDRDVIKVGYQPVQISILNNTKKHFYFSRTNISLPSVDAIEVAQLVHTNTAGRAAGYGVVGILIWPFLIPAIVDGIGSSRANELLDIDYEKKALKDQALTPFERINGLIFVPKESYSDIFQIQLIDQESSKQVVLETTKPFVQLEQD